LNFVLVYDPRLLAREPYARSHTEVLQRGQASLDAQLSRKWRLSLSESFAYGDYDVTSFSDVFNPVSGKIDSLPAVTTFLYESTYTQAAIAYQASRRVGLQLSGYYSDSGGVGQAARAYVPEQKLGHEELNVSVLAARADAWVTTGAANQVEFSSGQRYLGAELNELYQHRFARFTELDVTAGLQVVRGQVARGAPFVWSYFPEGVVAITHTMALAALGDLATLAAPATDAQQALKLVASLSAGPYFDRTTGQVYERAGSDVGLTYRFSRRWSLELRTGLAFGFQKPQVSQDVLALGQLSFVYHIAPTIALEAGARELVSALLFVHGSIGEEWLTFFALTWGVKEKV
jgi:hypothetical protein